MEIFRSVYFKLQYVECLSELLTFKKKIKFRSLKSLLQKTMFFLTLLNNITVLMKALVFNRNCVDI